MRDDKDFLAALDVAATEAAAAETGSLKSMAEMKFGYNEVVLSFPDFLSEFCFFSEEEGMELLMKGFDLEGMEEAYDALSGEPVEEPAKFEEEVEKLEEEEDNWASAWDDDEDDKHVPVEVEKEVDSESQSTAESFKLLDSIFADIKDLPLPVITIVIVNLKRGHSYEDSLALALACEDTAYNERETN